MRSMLSLTMVIAVLALAGCRGSAAAGPPVATSAAAAAPAATPPPKTPPGTEEGCRACRGIWGKHGISQTPSCNCRTGDGGKICRDGEDCQGLCVADSDNPARDVTDPGPPPRGYILGRCSEFAAIFGCYRPIDRGAAAHGPTPLGEPPAMLCAD
jgi:hypothetical protein